jgi:hypothetical protein
MVPGTRHELVTLLAFDLRIRNMTGDNQLSANLNSDWSLRVEHNLFAIRGTAFQEDRTHLGLQKETPGRRVRAAARGGVTALPRLGGLHHRYERVA